MTTAGWWLVLLTAGFTASSNLLLRAGIDRAQGFELSPDQLLRCLRSLAAQPLFDLGFVLLGLAALAWFRIVSAETLSTAYPLFISLVFVFVTLGAAVLFRESISLRKLGGLGVILIGIFLVGWE